MAIRDAPTMLPGDNTDEITGFIVTPADGMKVYTVPERGLEVLAVTIDGKMVMSENQAGHLSRSSFDGYAFGPLKSIEAAFTAGPENTGGPQEHSPLHGTFSQTPAIDHTLDRTTDGGIEGTIHWSRMVLGPSLDIHRTISPVKDSDITPYVFAIDDAITGLLTGYYKWLYHPNFPVENGTRFVSSETKVVPRPDGRSHVDAEGRFCVDGNKYYRLFDRVGEGVTLKKFPPSTVDDGGIPAIIKENFEKCYVIKVEPDANGDIYAALISKDGKKGVYVKYKADMLQPQQQAFQLWENRREGIAGLEVGSDFNGWDWAEKHDLLVPIEEGQTHNYRIEIGFLRNEEQVQKLLAKINQRTIGKVDYQVIDSLDNAKFVNMYSGGK